MCKLIYTIITSSLDDHMSNLVSHDKFSSSIADYIISKVAGTHMDDVEIAVRPSRLYLIGTLAAKKEIVDDSVVGMDDEKVSSIRASRIKVSILGNKENIKSKSKALVTCTGNIYSKIKNSNETNYDGENTNNQDLWKRFDFSYTFNVDLSTDSEIDFDFSSIVEKINSDEEVKSKISDSPWKAKLNINLKSFNPSDYLISFSMDNTSIEPREKEHFDRTLFNCKLEVGVDFDVKEFEDDYFYEGYRQRYFYDFRTINCHARWLDTSRKRFSTEYFARFEQPNIRPRDNLSNIDLSFKKLSLGEDALFSLDSFLNEMKHKNQIYFNNIPSDVQKDALQERVNNRQVFWNERIDLMSGFERLIARVENGIELIKSDKYARESFFKTNEVFYNYYANQEKKNAGWRLFQLAFLLSSIESVVKESDLDVVDVLHVDTGGGKSEAYFALIVFTAFYERMTGRKDGVSSIVKFPLRMLSIQQLERATSIIIHAENVRKMYEEYFPGLPFSIGYFVGISDEFPDTYKKNKAYLYEKGKLKSPAPESLIISKCPLCPSNSKGVVRLKDDTTHMRIIHQCDKCNEEYYIFTSDREIFRWRPTIIISTVDKWASLSLQRRIRNLLGGTGSMCPDGHGFIPSGDKCEDKDDEGYQCNNIGNNFHSSGPRLSIQDEMHLLREGFGTISSHFEGLIETIVEDRTNRKLKHITMSATLNGTPKQIKELYNKECFTIPGRCPEGTGSENDLFFEANDGPKRLIYGFKPNLRDNHYASLRTLLHFTEFIVAAQIDLNSDPHKFCANYGLSNAIDAQDMLNQYLVPLTYHLKKQDAYDMGRLEEAVVSDSLNKHAGSKVQGTVLTGDNNLEDLKNVILNVRSFVNNYDPALVKKEGLIFNPIYATSVISHGVDLEELNFMIFQGMPYSTSEYIQALSRIGRKKLGIVFLWFYPNRVRDDSFYRNFIRYHDSLDHEVRPVPINRGSRLGLLQTVNSIFCAGVINYLSCKKGRSLYRKKDVKELNDLEKSELIEFIKKVYGHILLDIDVSKEVEERLKYIISGNDPDSEFFPKILTKSGKPFFQTQTGMRGIQKKLKLDLSTKDMNKLNQMGYNDE